MIAKRHFQVFKCDGFYDRMNEEWNSREASIAEINSIEIKDEID